MFKNKTNKKLKVQQDVIWKLEQEIVLLESENEKLKQELSLEKEKPNNGYEKTKELRYKLESKIAEYQKLIDEVWDIRTQYSEKLKEINRLKNEMRKASRKK